MAERMDPAEAERIAACACRQPLRDGEHSEAHCRVTTTWGELTGRDAGDTTPEPTDLDTLVSWVEAALDSSDIRVTVRESDGSVSPLRRLVRCLRSAGLLHEGAGFHEADEAAEKIQAIRRRPPDAVTAPPDEDIAMAWHDVTCPEGPDCRDRGVHAMSSPLVHTGTLARFLDALRGPHLRAVPEEG